MAEIRIGDQLVGDGHPTYIIAEIGVNHNGLLELALQMIDVAVEAGVDAVKFQKRSLESLYAKKYLQNANAGEKPCATYCRFYSASNSPTKPMSGLLSTAGIKELLSFAPLSTPPAQITQNRWVYRLSK